MSDKEVRRVKGGSFDDVKTNERSNMTFLGDAFDLLNLSEHDGDFVKIRFLGGLVGTALHWVSIQKKDGDWANIPKQCLAFDPETLEMSDKVCPYCDAAAKFRKLDIKVKVKGKLNFPVATGVDYIYNAISRELQEEITPKITTKEEKESGLITKGSKSKTPVRVVRITGGLAKKLRDLKNLNVHLVSVKNKKTGETTKERVAQDLSHPKYGRDVFIKYDSKAADAASTYSVQRDDVTPLTEEEMAYLRWDIEAFPFMNEPESLEEANKNIESFQGSCWELISGKKKKKVEEVDYDDDDDEVDDDLDDDEDDEPVVKKKAKRKVVEDDEDDEPVVKKKATASKKRVVEDDEDDEPAPKAKAKKKVVEEDDEDDDDEPAPKASSKAKPKAKSKAVEEEDDDFDLDDLDEEDEPAPKAKAKKKSTPVDDDEDDEPVVKKKKKVVVDEDDDEDDEPAPKPKAKAKRKVVDEDDDDLPF